jgi:outer membrane lipoprotein SlyB
MLHPDKPERDLNPCSAIRRTFLRKYLLFALFIAQVLTVSANAVVVPGRWEKVESLPRGTTVIVHLSSGDRLQGALSKLNEEEILLSVAGDEVRLPKSGVTMIHRAQKVQGSGWKEMAIGAGIGVLVGGIVGRTCSGVNARGIAPVWGSLGAVAGFIVGRAVKKTEVLYVTR